MKKIGNIAKNVGILVFLVMLCLFVSQLSAPWRMNPYTNRHDYYVVSFNATQTATGDGTTTMNWKTGELFIFTFGAQNETFTFTAPANPVKIILILKQDGVGGRTIIWPADVAWPGDVPPTLSTGANDVDMVGLIYDGTSYLGLFNGNFE